MATDKPAAGVLYSLRIRCAKTSPDWDGVGYSRNMEVTGDQAD